MLHKSHVLTGWLLFRFPEGLPISASCPLTMCVLFSLNNNKTPCPGQWALVAPVLPLFLDWLQVRRFSSLPPFHTCPKENRQQPTSPAQATHPSTGRRVSTRSPVGGLWTDRHTSITRQHNAGTDFFQDESLGVSTGGVTALDNKGSGTCISWTLLRVACTGAGEARGVSASHQHHLRLLIMMIIIIIIMNQFSIAHFPAKTSSARLITNIQHLSVVGYLQIMSRITLLL